MLNSGMKDLYNAFICRDLLTRHALRATCKTLARWIKVDSEFIKTVGALVGRAPMERVAFRLLFLVPKYPAREQIWSPYEKHRPKQHIHFHWANKEGIGYSTIIIDYERFIGYVSSEAIDAMLAAIFECEDAAVVLECILNQNYHACIYKWMCWYDAYQKVMHLQHTTQT
jgi:hypothetical protein